MQRLERERADLQRLARAQAQARTGRNFSFTFMLFFVGSACWFLGYQYPRDVDPSSTLPLNATRPPTYKLNPAHLEAAWADFVEIVGQENVSTVDDDIKQHTVSEWSSHQPTDPAQKPFCVVYPSTTEQVSAIMKICHVRRIPVVGYSGGTSLEGHYTPTRGGICIDFSRMNKVLALHKEDLDVVVQPGVGWEELNEQLAQHNLFFPPDPGPGAQIGGMVGTGCSGTNAYRYGTMREWVLSLTVVLADGTVIKTRQRPRKSSAGYDLTRLFIGSEGTLGLVTEATLKLCVKPAAASVAVASFPSIRSAADCVARVVADGIPVAAVEILDDDQMRFINAHGTTSRRWREAPTIFFKFTGTAGGVKEQIDIVRQLARRAGSQSFDFAKDDAEQAELWQARKVALWSTMAQRRPGDRVWTGDVAVPMSRLPDIIEQTKKDFKTSGLTSSIVGHVGDGNFHVILLYSDAERKLAEDCVHRMVKRAVELEGTVTGEHGVGLVKRDYLPHELGETTVDAMRKIKAAFDPLCLLNCDKVVRVQKPARGEVAEW
ncbi:uncharacterized protein THITE_2069500 [Thermothielavioides terrestris NRRL 8126]|uniref:D-lactate dehydrogenase (cytochrome) n=2 Tax=Thermothielavioides terrestris TaxID=2587410 RepID=G2RDK0_THETT|nr:uncharacterized protein THITE_2069500 [Thermothielavioides terrestris NRRL 8126]AEO69982.1 hypothetical protein THITE_2069500 [Thermothielavioides terrestris NRRL 8126]